ncbi:hypothetical protein PCE1_005001 [Barthelona sp. PCE]
MDRSRYIDVETNIRNKLENIQEAIRRISRSTRAAQISQMQSRIPRIINECETLLRDSRTLFSQEGCEQNHSQFFQLLSDYKGQWDRELTSATRRLGVGENGRVANNEAAKAEAERIRQQAMISNEAQNVSQMVNNRNKEITEFVRDLGVVQDTMRDLSEAISTNDVGIESLQDNVDEAVVFIERGNRDLVTSEGKQRGNRSRLCCFFLITLVCALLVVYILLKKLKVMK